MIKLEGGCHFGRFIFLRLNRNQLQSLRAFGQTVPVRELAKCKPLLPVSNGFPLSLR